VTAGTAETAGTVDDVRGAALTRIAEHLAASAPGHPTRVAVDGITAAGKTTFARELTDAIVAGGRPALHLSTNEFHHPSAHRHRDPDAAVGYYRDAYDLVLFRRLVLDPLGPGGDLHYRARAHDLVTDDRVDEVPIKAVPDTVLVVDGTFLQSEALAGAWDEVIWLDVDEQGAVERALPRDRAQFGSDEATRAAFAQRYHAACRLYVAERSPHDHATVVVDNNDLAAPVVRRLGRSSI
jgi:uridine kinase